MKRNSEQRVAEFDFSPDSRVQPDHVNKVKKAARGKSRDIRTRPIKHKVNTSQLGGTDQTGVGMPPRHGKKSTSKTRLGQ